MKQVDAPVAIHVLRRDVQVLQRDATGICVEYAFDAHLKRHFGIAVLAAVAVQKQRMAIVVKARSGNQHIRQTVAVDVVEIGESFVD